MANIEEIQEVNKFLSSKITIEIYKIINKKVNYIKKSTDEELLFDIAKFKNEENEN